jgi:hypothetical protein
MVVQLPATPVDFDPKPGVAAREKYLSQFAAIPHWPAASFPQGYAGGSAAAG